MSEFDNIKSYEPSLISTGMMPRDDLGVRVKMTPFDERRGSYVNTADYNKLLAAYKELINLNIPMPKAPTLRKTRDSKPIEQA